MYPKALVMLALDPRDHTVVEALVASAARMGVRDVRVAHVHARDPFPAALAPPLAPTDRPELLDRAVEELRQRLPGCSVVGVHAVGRPDEELAHIIEAEDIDLLVIGRSRAEGGKDGWGPRGRKLLHAITCSALVVPEGARLDLADVVVGFDFSHCSAEALSIATHIADRVEAVYQYDLAAAGTGALTAEEFQIQLSGNALNHFEGTVLPQLGPVPRPELVVIPGADPAGVLVSVAGERPIVMGSRGLTRLALMLLGSTAETVAGMAEGPVLIARKKGETTGLLEGLIHR